jgi:hypothetical protein
MPTSWLMSWIQALLSSNDVLTAPSWAAVVDNIFDMVSSIVDLDEVSSILYIASQSPLPEIALLAWAATDLTVADS